MQKNKAKQIVVNFYNKDNLRNNKIAIAKKKRFRLIK